MRIALTKFSSINKHQHDPSGTCSPGSSNGGNYIMYAKATSGSEDNNFKFSQCSKNYMWPVIQAKSSCFYSKTFFIIILFCCPLQISSRNVFVKFQKTFYSEIALKVNIIGAKNSVYFMEISSDGDYRLILKDFTSACINQSAPRTTVQLIELSTLCHIRFREIPMYLNQRYCFFFWYTDYCIVFYKNPAGGLFRFI